MRRALFWSALGLIAYTYLLYPLVAFLRGLLWRAPYRSAEITPRISVIIAAYNEAASIGARLENLLGLDYPTERLEVIVASDGSSDGTNEIVRAYAPRGVTLLALPRQGKVPALNAAAAMATGEILVFSDANSLYAPDALRALVRPFADPSVGGVAGNQQYLPAGNGTGSGERSYWTFDQALKAFQSRAGNAISATGAIYAIRRSLFRPIPQGVTDDFVTSTSVIAQGYRLVYAPDAVAYEAVAASNQAEFNRKVRVISQGIRSLLAMRELLNPFRHGFYAVQLFSHKLLRRLMVFPLLLLALVSPALWRHGRLYRLATLAQAAFYGCALLGWRLRHAPLGHAKLFALPFYFCMVNIAALIATFKVLRGARIDRWEPQRREA